MRLQTKNPQQSRWDTDHWWRLPFWGKINSPLLVRLLVGSVLLAAATLKAHQTIISPTPTQLPPELLVTSEWLLATWLVCGIWPRWSTTLASVVFAVFCLVNLLLLVQQKPSCGCLGSVPVPPLAILILDVALLTMLIRVRNLMPISNKLAFRQISIAALGLVGGGFVVYLMVLSRPRVMGADGAVTPGSPHVLLHPESWIGERFPLEDHIANSQDLMMGRWHVLLHHRNCEACRQKARELQTTQAENTTLPLAFLEVPPVKPAGVGDRADWVGKLDNTYQWIVPTPTVLWLRDGIVTQVQVQDRSPVHLDTNEISVAKPAFKVADAAHELRFGYVKPGSTNQKSVVVYNSLPQPVKIIGIDAECACTTIPISLTELKPGVTKIPVQFVAPDQIGPYSKHLVLRCESREMSAIMVKVTARIGQPLVISPATVDLGVLPVDEARTISVAVRNDGTDPVRLLYAVSNSACCSAQVPRDGLPGGTEVAIEVRVQPHSNPGTYRITLKIHTSLEAQRVLSLPLTYQVQQPSHNKSAFNPDSSVGK